MPGQGKPFERGHDGGPGRPKGTTDKKWLSLRYWFELVESNLAELKPKERAEIGMHGLSLLIGKMKTLPATPEESVKNVVSEEAMQAFQNGNIALND